MTIACRVWLRQSEGKINTSVYWYQSARIGQLSIGQPEDRSTIVANLNGDSQSAGPRQLSLPTISLDRPTLNQRVQRPPTIVASLNGDSQSAGPKTRQLSLPTISLDGRPSVSRFSPANYHCQRSAWTADPQSAGFHPSTIIANNQPGRPTLSQQAFARRLSLPTISLGGRPSVSRLLPADYHCQQSAWTADSQSAGFDPPTTIANG